MKEKKRKVLFFFIKLFRSNSIIFFFLIELINKITENFKEDLPEIVRKLPKNIQFKSISDLKVLATMFGTHWNVESIKKRANGSHVIN